MKNLLNLSCSKIHENREIFFSSLIFLLALLLRIHHLDFESLWMDELRQVSYYHHSFTQIIQDAASQQQPPLDYWIGHIIHKFSSSDYAVRLPSALFGAGSILLLTLMVSRMCSWPVAICSGVIAALLPFNVYYSQEARPYAIAVFFFLAVLWQLERLLSGRGRNTINAAILLFVSTGFLYSRSLSPLVIVFLLMFFLGAKACIQMIKSRFEIKSGSMLLFLAPTVLMTAIFIYLPNLYIVLSQGKRYADTALSFEISALVSVLKKYDILPLWHAFIVQTEPLTYPILALLVMSPYCAWKLGLWTKSNLWQIIAFLLPAASILHLLIMQLKSPMPFRPPYAIDLLPLVLIQAAVSFQGLLFMAEKKSRFIKYLLMGLLAVLIIALAVSVIDYKSIRKKTDWRGVCGFLMNNSGKSQVLIFDSLSMYGQWEPTFYGFERYYHGDSPMLAMAQIPFIAGNLSEVDYEPVIVLFHWREYFLISGSKYPVVPFPSKQMKNIDYRAPAKDPLLKTREFTGFSIITLAEPERNFAKDAFTLIERLLLSFPQDSWLVELHLAAARLAGDLNFPARDYHLNQAEALGKNPNMDRIRKILEYIKGLDQ